METHKDIQATKRFSVVQEVSQPLALGNIISVSGLLTVWSDM